MNIEIKCSPLKVEKADFNYSNIKSRYGANTLYFTKDNEPYMIIAGELHFSRVPEERWRETLLKMKALGLNCVTTYVFWNYHEEDKDKFDFKGNKNINKFLSVCKIIDMPCVLRIGPWCHGEAVYGGLPKRIAEMPNTRTNDTRYLKEVKDFWSGLYKEVEEFLDGETVIGIQLENEYCGDIGHLKALRKIAEEIGYKTPFFTMTAWPTGIPDNDFIALFGGYPDAPWSDVIGPLEPNNRFAIAPYKTADEIGADLIRSKNISESKFAHIPYATCEIGPGVQPTNHRRPKISAKDGYGVGFAKIASGVNWQGYYMFCGGNNPNDRLMQESKLTGYPNDYSIIDYDFQAPISKYGYVREHGHMLRLLHLFANSFDTMLPKKQTFFPKWNSKNPMDKSFVKCSVRVDEEGSGYFFCGNYEKNLSLNSFNDVNVSVYLNNKIINLPKVNVESGSMFFYPFNLKVDELLFDYIVAQPIAQIRHKNGVTCYFKPCEGNEPIYSVNGIKHHLKADRQGITMGKVRIVLLSEEDSKKFYVFNNKAYFIDGTAYEDDGVIYSEKITDLDIKDKFKLERIEPVDLPYDYYLYSVGERAFYKLSIPNNILDIYYDVSLKFEFEGLNLQVFSGEKIINDWFNIDKDFVMSLRDYKNYLVKNSEIIIKTVPKTQKELSEVYNEVELPINSNSLKLVEAKVIVKETI